MRAVSSQATPRIGLREVVEDDPGGGRYTVVAGAVRLAVDQIGGETWGYVMGGTARHGKSTRTIHLYRERAGRARAPSTCVGQLRIGRFFAAACSASGEVMPRKWGLLVKGREAPASPRGVVPYEARV